MATLKEKIGYGLGDMSSSIFWKLMTYYLPWLYGSAFGLDFLTTGTMIAVSRVWDAVSDPIMGLISDRTWSRKGHFRPYLLWFSVPLAISAIMLFTTPGPGVDRKIWAYTTYLIMTAFYTAINVPYAAMLGAISRDRHEKTIFAVFRMAFAYAGGFLVLLLWEPLCNAMGGYSGLGATSGWQHSMIVVAAISVVLFALCFFLTKENIPLAKPKPVLGELKDLYKNLPWWVLSGAAYCSSMFSTFRGTVMLFYFQYYFGQNDSSLLNAGLFMAAGEISNMAGIMLLTVPLSKRFGKKQVLVGCGVAMAALSAAFFFVPGSGAGLRAAYGLQVLLGITTGIISPLIWSMYADVSDYSQYKNGTPSVGLIFSTGSMAQKLGVAMASATVMWLLAGFGLDTSQAEQGADAILGLKLCMSIYPAGIAVIMAYACTIYPLNDKALDEVSSSLSKEAARQETQAAPKQ